MVKNEKGIEKNFDGFSIFTGTVRYSDLTYLLGTEDVLVAKDIPHARVFGFDQGQLGANDISWSAVSSSVCWYPEERFIVISPFGRVYTIGGGKEPEESILKDGKISPKTRGPLREVRGIAGGRAYAVGTCRQVYRRDTPKKWTCIDKTAQTPVKDITETCFESLDGFSETDIFTAGWEGEIWHYEPDKSCTLQDPMWEKR